MQPRTSRREGGASGPPESTRIPTSVARGVVLVWILCHIPYPLWFPPSGSLKAAVALYAVLCAIGVSVALWLKPALAVDAPDSPESREILRDLLTPPADPVLWALLALVVAVRLYPTTLPVHLWEGGDEALHMGVPALPFKLLARNLPFPYPAITWGVLILGYAFRRRLGEWARFALRSTLEARPWALGAIALFSTGYFSAGFAAIRYFLRTGHPTFVADLLRFPPLCKWVRVPFYAAFGVSNFMGRLPEFLFYLSTGLIVYKILAAFRSRAAGRIGAGLVWFFPPIAYYGVRGSQTMGEAFFYVLVCYFYAQWALRGRRAALYWAAFAVGAGSMYRYTVPLLAGVLAILTTLPRRGKEGPPWRVVFECAGIVAAMIGPWMTAYFAYKVREYSSLAGHSLAEKLLAPALTLPQAASWPVAALLALALAAALIRRKDALTVFVLCWLGAYYLFIGMDLGFVVRLNIPIYLALVLLAGETLCSIAPEAWAQGAGALAVGYLFIVSTFAAVPPMEPRYALRYSLRTDYVPLTAAAKELDRIPDGTRILAIDCSQGCFTIDLRRPRALEWTVVDSKNIPSLEALRDLCVKNRIAVVMYAAGTREAFGAPMNPGLFRAFEEATGWLSPRKEFVLGDNKIVFKNVSASPGLTNPQT